MNILRRIGKLLLYVLILPVTALIAFLYITIVGFIVIPVVIILDSQEQIFNEYNKKIKKSS